MLVDHEIVIHVRATSGPAARCPGGVAPSPVTARRPRPGGGCPPPRVTIPVGRWRAFARAARRGRRADERNRPPGSPGRRGARARGGREPVARAAGRHGLRLDGAADVDRSRRHQRRHRLTDRGTRARATVHRTAGRTGQPHRCGGQPAATGTARRAEGRHRRGPTAHRHDHPAARAGRAESSCRRDLDPARLLRDTGRRKWAAQDQLSLRPGDGGREGRARGAGGHEARSSTGGPATPAAARWSPPSRSSPGSRSTTTRRSTWRASSR